jgi:DNA-binding HxlR family transcriptional regulator
VRFEELDELRAAAWLDSITSNFYYHGEPPLAVCHNLIGNRVYWLAESPKHFARLRQVMPGISQKVLTQQLRELVGDGIVQRQLQGAIPAPVEYSLTDYGRSLLPLVEEIRRWGRAHMERLTSQTDAPVGDP